MRRLLILLVGAFVLTFGAGIMAEKLATHLQTHEAQSEPQTSQPSWILEPLHLNAQQTQQMRGIWEGVNDKVRDCENQRASLHRDCDAAIFEMLTPQQKAEYNQKMSDYQKKFDIIDKTQQAAFSKGVEQTRVILNPEQQETYQQILKEKVGYGVGAAALSEGTATNPATRPAAGAN